MKFLFYALGFTMMTTFLSAYYESKDMLPLAAVIIAGGMYIVFTIGRISGMKEMHAEIKGQNERTNS